jgi:hypothetical protein
MKDSTMSHSKSNGSEPIGSYPSDEQSLSLQYVAEFVAGFLSSGELCPIGEVSEVTGLTPEEIRSSSEIFKVRR